MNSEIERLQSAIALEIYEVRPEGEWIEGTYRVICITTFLEGACLFRLKDGTEKSGDTSYRSSQLFFDLRKEMAKLNNNGHAWYAASCTLSDVGKFRFEFNYDHLPAFEIIPDAERWLLEFKDYPRPELQSKIQDWIDGKAEPAVIVERLKKWQGAVKA
ncbi:hypothetical protein [Massilia sp. CCM 8734]|uniref:hypothetical protein n=1 Tax=Massilia sp. CCM 8734 TaxID=2609283 RepID=UPI001422D101|nr:hypothetical protein [Massilia sp. CCM 8734]NIA00849.1 hypothetical protein [Massilia sp. CCM 8734]